MRTNVKGKATSLAKPTEAKGRSNDSSGAAAEQRTWKAGSRPSGSAACQDSSFTLEDESLSSSLEALFGCFCCWDPSLPGCPIVSASPGFESLTGYSSQEFVGRRSSSKLLQGPRTEAEAVAALSAGVDSCSFTSVEITLHKASGKPFRSLVCLVPVVDAAGAVVCWMEVHCDLDEKRRGADADQFATRWSEQVKLQSSNYLLLDAGSINGNIAAVGSGLATLTSYSSSSLAGCSCLSLAGPSTTHNSMKKLMGGLTGQKQTTTTMLLHKRDGSAFWALVVVVPLSLTREQLQNVLSHYGPSSQAYGSGAAMQQQQQQDGVTRAPGALVLVLDVTMARPKRLGKYLLGKVLGQGASGLVRMGKNTQTDELVAVKSVDASRFRSLDEIQQVQEEMAVLSQLKHPNIIRLQEVHFMGNVFFFIMDWASGGSLVQYIYSQEGHSLDEPEARRIFTQMLSGLEYCHKRRVIHRDLKPENILMEAGNPKIADFGLAGVMAPFNASGFTLQCGTPEFTAPEIVEGKEYEGPSVDLWSMGVMMYEALSGELPFKGSSQSALFKAIQKGVYPPLPEHISAEGRDLVKRLLNVVPASRITWAELNRHPWMVGPGGASISSSGAAGGGSGVAAIVAAAAGHGTSSSGAPSPRSGSSQACSSGGFADGSRMCREGTRASEGGGELPCREISDAAALSDGSELDSGLSSAELEPGDEDGGQGDPSSSDAGGLGGAFNSSIRSSRQGYQGDSRGEYSGGGSGSDSLENSLRGARGGPALSFTSKPCHDSVRVVIPGGNVDKDDPILAAIMRTAESFSAGMSPASTRAHLLEEVGPSSPRSASFSIGSASPVTPGGRGVGSGASGALTGAGRGPLGAIAKNLVGSPGSSSTRSARTNSSTNLPPLSPNSAQEGAGGGARRAPSTSGQPQPGALSAPRSAAAGLLSKAAPGGGQQLKEHAKNYTSNLSGGSGQQKGGSGSGAASPTSMLPPIGRDRGNALGRSMR